MPTSAPSIAEISARVVAALPPEARNLELTPALPVNWPPRAPELEWLLYENTPLPTGMIAYTVKGPTFSVLLVLPNGRPQVTARPGAKDLGRKAAGRASAADVAAAEQALLEVVLGLRSAESARSELATYSHWAAPTSPIGSDLRRLKPEFFAWLDSASP
jgi:hypothetical protein